MSAVDEGDRAAFITVSVLALAFVALVTRAHFRSVPVEEEAPRKIARLRDAPKVFKSAEELGRRCPAGQFCRVVSGGPNPSARVRILDDERTLVIDDHELSIIGPGDHVIALSQPAGAPILDVTVDPHGDLFALDQTGAIVFVAKDGKTSEIVDHVAAPTANKRGRRREGHGQIAFQDGSMFVVFGTRFLKRVARGMFQELTLPGLSEPGDPGADDYEESGRKYRVRDVELTTDAHGNGLIAYNEPLGTARAIARVFRFEHGLATEIFGLEDNEITSVALGAGEDVWLTTKEKTGDQAGQPGLPDQPSEKTISRVLLRKNGETIKVVESTDEISRASFDGKEACFATKGSAGISWYSVQDPKTVPPPQEASVLVESLDSVVCRGHSRLAAVSDAGVIDFDGTRILYSQFDQREPDAKTMEALFIDNDAHVNLVSSLGTFRVSPPPFSKIDSEPMQPSVFTRAPDGTWWTTIAGQKDAHSMLARFTGSSWEVARKLDFMQRFLFGASSTDTFTTTQYGMGPYDIFKNGVKIATLPKKYDAVRSGYGAPDDAYFVVGVNRKDISPGAVLLHWDGKKLSPVDGIDDDVRSLVATALDDITVLADAGTLRHFDGTRWSDWPSLPPELSYARIVANERAHVTAVGSDGTLADITATGIHTSDAFLPSTRAHLVSQGKTTWILASGSLYKKTDN